MHITFILAAAFAGFAFGIILMIAYELDSANKVLDICKRVIEQMERRDNENKRIVDYLVKEHKKHQDKEESVGKGL